MFTVNYEKRIIIFHKKPEDVPEDVFFFKLLTVNPEIFARFFFSRIEIKDIFATFKIRA